LHNDAGKNDVSNRIWFGTMFFAALAPAVAACVLQSRSPLFSAEQGTMFLSYYGKLQKLENSGGKWVRSAEQMSFAPEGSHYIAVA
jgi:hypothetical protein